MQDLRVRRDPEDSGNAMWGLAAFLEERSIARCEAQDRTMHHEPSCEEG